MTFFELLRDFVADKGCVSGVGVLSDLSFELSRTILNACGFPAFTAWNIGVDAWNELVFGSCSHAIEWLAASILIR